VVDDPEVFALVLATGTSGEPVAPAQGRDAARLLSLVWPALGVPDEPGGCRAKGDGRGDKSDNDGDHEVLPLSAMPASLTQRYPAAPRECQWQRDWFAGGNRLTAYCPERARTAVGGAFVRVAGEPVRQPLEALTTAHCIPPARTSATRARVPGTFPGVARTARPDTRWMPVNEPHSMPRSERDVVAPTARERAARRKRYRP
jgi:hypothetical protein